MARHIALTILASFSVAFSGLHSLEAFLASHSHTPTSHGADAAASAFLLAIAATFALALALLFAHVRALGAHAAGGAAHGFGTGRLAAAALGASVAALLAGAALHLVG